MSPRKSQKKFSALPKLEKKPAAQAGIEAVAPAVPKPAPVVPVMVEVTNPVEVVAAVETPAAEATAPVAQATAASSRAAELIAALGDLDADVARDAAAELGLLKDQSAVAPLIAALSNTDGFTHPVVRAAAAASLGQLGSASAVEPLIAAIGDSMAEASSEAIRALAILGDARAVPALIEVARNESRFTSPPSAAPRWWRRAAWGAAGRRRVAPGRRRFVGRLGHSRRRRRGDEEHRDDRRHAGLNRASVPGRILSLRKADASPAPSQSRRAGEASAFARSYVMHSRGRTVRRVILVLRRIWSI